MFTIILKKIWLDRPTLLLYYWWCCNYRFIVFIITDIPIIIVFIITDIPIIIIIINLADF